MSISSVSGRSHQSSEVPSAESATSSPAGGASYSAALQALNTAFKDQMADGEKAEKRRKEDAQEDDDEGGE